MHSSRYVNREHNVFMHLSEDSKPVAPQPGCWFGLAPLPAAAVRDRAAHLTTMATRGLPLLQPLPPRWSGRPRGLRIVIIINIAKTIAISIVNNISIDTPPVVASLRQ